MPSVLSGSTSLASTLPETGVSSSVEAASSAASGASFCSATLIVTVTHPHMNRLHIGVAESRGGENDRLAGGFVGTVAVEVPRVREGVADRVGGIRRHRRCAALADRERTHPAEHGRLVRRDADRLAL